MYKQYNLSMLLYPPFIFLILTVLCPLFSLYPAALCTESNNTFVIFFLIPTRSKGEVEFKGEIGFLSSGYQAIVRIFMELLYYQEKCLLERHIDYGMVVIDELDEFLSPGYARNDVP